MVEVRLADQVVGDENIKAGFEMNEDHLASGFIVEFDATLKVQRNFVMT